MFVLFGLLVVWCCLFLGRFLRCIFGACACVVDVLCLRVFVLLVLFSCVGVVTCVSLCSVVFAFFGGGGCVGLNSVFFVLEKFVCLALL